MEDRDTHFAGFARLLMQEVDEKNREKAHSTGRYLDEEELRQIIAQRAYDLAEHVVESIEYPHLHTVPDMTEWPERPKE